MISLADNEAIEAWRIHNKDDIYYFSLYERTMGGNPGLALSSDPKVTIEKDMDELEGFYDVETIEDFLQSADSLGAVFGSEDNIFVLIYIAGIGLVEFNKVSANLLELSSYASGGIPKKYHKLPLTNFIHSNATIDDLCSIFGEPYKAVLSVFYLSIKEFKWNCCNY